MKCDRCGKETVVKDALGTTTNNYGISVTPDIELTAQVCYSCGHVELEVDPEEYLDGMKKETSRRVRDFIYQEGDWAYAPSEFERRL